MCTFNPTACPKWPQKLKDDGLVLRHNIPDRLAALRTVLARDGVHFLEIGSKNIAHRSIVAIKQLLARPEKSVKRTCFFWRGFFSPHRSTLPTTSPGMSSQERITIAIGGRLTS
jgi:hypothetical protein